MRISEPRLQLFQLMRSSQQQRRRIQRRLIQEHGRAVCQLDHLRKPFAHLPHVWIAIQRIVRQRMMKEIAHQKEQPVLISPGAKTGALKVIDRIRQAVHRAWRAAKQQIKQQSADAIDIAVPAKPADVAALLLYGGKPAGMRDPVVFLSPASAGDVHRTSESKSKSWTISCVPSSTKIFSGLMSRYSQP